MNFTVNFSGIARVTSFGGQTKVENGGLGVCPGKSLGSRPFGTLGKLQVLIKNILKLSMRGFLMVNCRFGISSDTNILTIGGSEDPPCPLPLAPLAMLL